MIWNVQVCTARQVKGAKWAERYPDKADDLWVVATGRGKRKRERIGPNTQENQERAERIAAQLRQELGVDGARLGSLTVREAADDYLRDGVSHQAPGTRETLTYRLDRLCRTLGPKPLDRLRVADITRWWADFVETEGRDYRTGMAHLEALNAVLRDAIFRGTVDVDVNPVREARERIRDRYRRTRAMRGRDEANRRPLTLEQYGSLMTEDDLPLNTRLFIALLGDAGLRLGEALALRFDDVEEAALRVKESLDLRWRAGPTKTGTTRRVDLSRRLAALIREQRMARGRPAGHVRILARHGRDTYRRRLTAAAAAAGLGRKLTPKDLRDTFASQLLTLGVQLGYVSRQLGHTDVTTTSRHYATWCEEGYRRRPDLEQNEVPADMLAGRATTMSPAATKGGGAE